MMVTMYSHIITLASEIWADTATTHGQRLRILPEIGVHSDSLFHK